MADVWCQSEHDRIAVLDGLQLPLAAGLAMKRELFALANSSEEAKTANAAVSWNGTIEASHDPSDLR